MVPSIRIVAVAVVYGREIRFLPCSSYKKSVLKGHQSRRISIFLPKILILCGLVILTIRSY